LVFGKKIKQGTERLKGHGRRKENGLYLGEEKNLGGPSVDSKR